jgi:large subunit ribosomal protein L3
MTTDRLFREGLLGKKLGMTQVITAEGQCIPVTIVEAGPCFVLDVKNWRQTGLFRCSVGVRSKKDATCKQG